MAPDTCVRPRFYRRTDVVLRTTLRGRHQCGAQRNDEPLRRRGPALGDAAPATRDARCESAGDGEKRCFGRFDMGFRLRC